jgi:hypothetical protein
MIAGVCGGMRTAITSSPRALTLTSTRAAAKPVFLVRSAIYPISARVPTVRLIGCTVLEPRQEPAARPISGSSVGAGECRFLEVA